MQSIGEHHRLWNRMLIILAGAMLLLPAMAVAQVQLQPQAPDEKFVPMNMGGAVAGTLEVKQEVRVESAEVRLRDLCRWNQQDDQAMAPVADLVVTRIGSRTPYQAIGVEEIKSTLREAGINLGLIRFTGAQVCTVARSEMAADPLATTRQWGDVQSQASQMQASQMQASPMQTAPNQSSPNPDLPAQNRSGPSATPQAWDAQGDSAGQGMTSQGQDLTTDPAAAGWSGDDVRPATFAQDNGAAANQAMNAQPAAPQHARGNDDPAQETADDQPRLDPVAMALRGEPDQTEGVPAGAYPRPRNAPQAMQPIQPANQRTLKQALIQDLAEKLNVTSQDLLLEFRPEDEARLAMREPEVKFEITSRRTATLGKVSWDVAMVSIGGVRSQSMTLTAYARMWQEQVVAARPVSFKQLLRDEDLVNRRVLVDRLNDSVLLKRQQVVGQLAAVEIKPGLVFTARMVDPMPMVRTGQLVTVTIKRGAFEIKTAGRAMETGTIGQSIRVRNEVTKDIFQVVITGPQAGSISEPNGTEPQDVASAVGR